MFMALRLTVVLAAAFLLSITVSTRAASATLSFCLSEHPWEEAIDEATPAAGSNGETCLVVWKDNRADRRPRHQGTYLLYGRRFDRAGNPIDATSFPIQDEPFAWNNEGLTLPAVGSLGRDYLVVWLTRFRQVVARRLTADGAVLTDEIQIARTGTATGRPALASTRRGHLVAWTDRENNNGDVYATLLDRNGAVTQVVPVAVGDGNAQFPVAASAGPNYLVVWRELVSLGKGAVRAALITQAGEVRPLDSFPSVLASSATVAGNGRNFFVAWQTGLGEFEENEFAGCLVNCRGTRAGRPALLSTGEPQESLFGVLPGGRQFTVLWRDNPQAVDAALRTVPVSSQGIPKSDPSPAVSEIGWSGYGAAVPVSRSGVLVVLEQKTPDYQQNGYLSRVYGNLITRGR